ncbi:hypothetical protein ACA910_005255 [Epithemia clementina (nom. ined.)]
MKQTCRCRDFRMICLLLLAPAIIRSTFASFAVRNVWNVVHNAKEQQQKQHQVHSQQYNYRKRKSGQYSVLLSHKTPQSNLPSNDHLNARRRWTGGIDNEDTAAAAAAAAADDDDDIIKTATFPSGKRKAQSDEAISTEKYPMIIKAPELTRGLDRRAMIGWSISSVMAAAVATQGAAAEVLQLQQQRLPFADPLEHTMLGKGTWQPMTAQSDVADSTSNNDSVFPPFFVTYLTRFLICYDVGVKQWWDELEHKFSLLPVAERHDRLSQKFGAFAQSLQQGLWRTTTSTTTIPTAAVVQDLWDLMMNRYASLPQSDDILRQMTLLFALLPWQFQPLTRLRPILQQQKQSNGKHNRQATDATILDQETSWNDYFTDLTSLLPPSYHCELTADGQSIKIVPSLPIIQDGAFTNDNNNNNNDDQIVTCFGPLAASPLERGLPTYSPLIYALFGISGATGCALTHTVVIPLDVVKTRAQTNPISASSTNNNDSPATNQNSNIMATANSGQEDGAPLDNSGGNIVNAAVDIVQNEGVDALLLGAQATIAGYFWYGLSVYPSYTFFKRIFTLKLLPPEIATVHANDIALVAGALAAVVASVGLTPIEAARIRAVAEPQTYRPLGLLGTLNWIAQEDAALGWQSLYAGFPSLLARQVIFGSVKFLAFERACEFIFALWPSLRDFTWTSLCVSLIAGAFSGTLSSVVSQPADSLLTFVAQKSNSGTSNSNGNGGSTMGLLEGCRIMIEQDGPGSLFRGLGSRCVWAGSIIAGQFLLYDVFRTFFHVSSTDLSQVYEVVVDVPTAAAATFVQ